MESINYALWMVSTYLWGLPLSALLAGTGLYLTFKLGFIQLKGFRGAFHYLLAKDRDAVGELSYYQAVSTAMSSTIGTGNIVGVATAIAIGGPGAVLWMWLVAILGMATKYSECVLAITYRDRGPYGVRGGPMYYIEKGLGERYRPLAMMFAACAVVAVLGTGNLVQSNAASSALIELFSPVLPASPERMRPVFGVFLCLGAGLVIVGGIKRIGVVAGYMMPFMATMYILFSVVTLALNWERIVPALWQIIHCTPSPAAAAGGFAGGGVWLALRMGVARGTFSNEAGLGSAPIAYATIKTDHPVKGGLVALLEPFVDTVIVCTMTALVIITSGLWETGLSGVVLTSRAFEAQLPVFGPFVVPFSLCLFAFTSAIGWYYYGEKCIEYLAGSGWIPVYKVAFIAVLFIGAIARLDIVWNFADITNAMMALPNLIALILLSDVVREKTKDYFESK
ncbi:MAG: alanine/glycine:cation symporter family protein [Planctomycetota bacterium]|jgi:AGCS family alanine or glycine:cation symporter